METVSRETPRLEPWFVTGLMEGLGTFTFSRRFGEKLDLYFAMKGRAEDRSLLEGVRAFLGAGRIYEVAPAAAASGGGTADGSNSVANEGPKGSHREPARVYFRIHRKGDLEAVVSHLDRYPLRGAKREVYSLWRQMADQVRKPHRNIDWARVQQLASELSRNSRRRRKPEEN